MRFWPLEEGLRRDADPVAHGYEGVELTSTRVDAGRAKEVRKAARLDQAEVLATPDREYLCPDDKMKARSS